MPTGSSELKQQIKYFVIDLDNDNMQFISSPLHLCILSLPLNNTTDMGALHSCIDMT